MFCGALVITLAPPKEKHQSNFMHFTQLLCSSHFSTLRDTKCIQPYLSRFVSQDHNIVNVLRLNARSACSGTINVFLRVTLRRTALHRSRTTFGVFCALLSALSKCCMNSIVILEHSFALNKTTGLLVCPTF